MNPIDSAVTGVLSAKQAALQFKIELAVGARQQDLARMKGEMVADLIRKTERRSPRPATQQLFDGMA
jgi:hypothetical protein